MKGERDGERKEPVFNIEEVFRIPLRAHISVRQVEELIQNIVKSENDKSFVARWEKTADEYGFPAYLIKKTPTLTLEELLGGVEHEEVKYVIKLEELMWGLYYYIVQGYTITTVQAALATPSHKKVMSNILNRILASDKASLLMKYYRTYHKKGNV
jgi:hypothetical protein